VAVIDINDDAKAFDPLSAPKPDIHAPLEERAIGGLGVYIVKALMDRVSYDYADGRNHVRLEKALPIRG
jgi:serine/threonine-protein kinase RsbW